MTFDQGTKDKETFTICRSVIRVVQFCCLGSTASVIWAVRQRPSYSDTSWFRTAFSRRWKVMNGL